MGNIRSPRGRKRTGDCGRAMREIMWMNKDTFSGDEPESIVGKGWGNSLE
jgi:hypothetical protein